jgi:hypothetical protein
MLRAGSIVMALAVALAVGACGDGDVSTSGAEPTPTRPAHMVTSATPLVPPTTAYADAVRAAFNHMHPAIARAKATFNGARTPAQAREGLEGYERTLRGLLLALDAAGPPPPRLAAKHERWVAATRSMAAAYARLRALAHGSASTMRKRMEPAFEHLARIGPHWAKTGDALLNALDD